MTTTLNFDLKKIFEELSKEYRWNVLTVLILHANRRNRTWVSMSTITTLATNGNRNKASKAKKWLQEHDAFILVPFDKRFEEETKLPPRLHIYELTGIIKMDDNEYPYLYYSSSNSMDGETIKNMDGNTFDSMDGETGSISNSSKSKESTTPSPNGDTFPLSHNGNPLSLLKNAIMLHGVCISLDSPATRAHWWYVSPIASWLNGEDKPTHSRAKNSETIPGCEPVANADEVIAFLIEWRNKTGRDGKPLNIPESVGVFAKEFSKWRSAKSQAPIVSDKDVRILD